MPRSALPDPAFDEEFVARAHRGGGLRGLQAYEDAAVRAVLAGTGLGRGGLAGAIAGLTAERTGTAACTFAAFHATLPTFPLRLGVARLRDVKFLALPDLFNSFGKTALHRALVDLAEQGPVDGPLGVIFSYTGDRQVPGPKGGKFTILHTFPSTLPAGATRVVHAGRLAGRPAVFVLETLASLMVSFRDWRPD